MRSNNLKRSKSCGCITNALFDDSVIGKKFGKLTVIERPEKGRWNDVLWNCKCDCGAFRTVSSRDLYHGNVTSCGCGKKNHDGKIIWLVGENNHFYTHGDSPRGKVSRIYSIYHDMIRRCESKNRDDYKNYGGRGICVCEEWKNSYPAFKHWALSNGYSDDLTIDRIDVNGNYCPENCRWVTIKEQNNNRRSNHYVEINGRRMSLSKACDELNLPYDVIRARIQKGWSEEETFSIPIGTTRKEYYASNNQV